MSRYTFSDPPGQWTLPLARPGLPLILASAFVTLVFAVLGFTAVTLLGLAWTLALVGFFRDPDRPIPAGAESIVCPADGKVIVAEAASRNPFTGQAAGKVSIFMSVFNVHVNRIPREGRVTQVSYHPGRFYAADRRRASAENEQNAVFIETDRGDTLCVVQVAGLVARRIICQVQPGDEVKRGQRFGMICFGSRLDVYLPAETQLAVRVGERVSAGTSVLARYA